MIDAIHKTCGTRVDDLCCIQDIPRTFVDGLPPTESVSNPSATVFRLYRVFQESVQSTSPVQSRIFDPV